MLPFWRRFVVLACFVAACVLSGEARAAPKVTRKGGQWSVLVGGSTCVPGRAGCRRDATPEGLSITGRTRPSLGLGGELGYRFNEFVFAGATYRFGMFDLNYLDETGAPYDVAYQHSIYGVIRPTLPLWRFDLGLSMGPGYSRQVFRLPWGDRDHAAGFSFLMGPTVDLFIAERIFAGVRADLLLNAQGDICHTRAGATACSRATAADPGPFHQLTFGLHLGGTFL